MATIHQVTDKDGTVHRRTSQNKVYSHAIIIHTTHRAAFSMWASRADLAEKAAAPYRGKDWIKAIEILPAVIVDRKGRPIVKPVEDAGVFDMRQLKREG